MPGQGLAGLYERRSEPGRLDRLLPYEWRKCAGKIAGEENVRHWPTSDLSTRPPAEESAWSAEYGLIRQWLTAVLCAAEDPARVRGWGGRAVAVRLVLLALGQAAMVSAARARSSSAPGTWPCTRLLATGQWLVCCGCSVMSLIR